MVTDDPLGLQIMMGLGAFLLSAWFTSTPLSSWFFAPFFKGLLVIGIYIFVFYVGLPIIYRIFVYSSIWNILIGSMFPFLLFGVLIGWIMTTIKEKFHPLLVLFVVAGWVLIEGVVLFAIYHVL